VGEAYRMPNPRTVKKRSRDRRDKS
jgi:hypothetical protein